MNPVIAIAEGTRSCILDSELRSRVRPVLVRSRGLHHAIVPRFAHGTGDGGSGFAIVDEAFLLWIPLDFSAHADSGDSKVAHGCGSMADLCIANGFLPGSYRLDKIGHVVVALVESVGA